MNHGRPIEMVIEALHEFGSNPRQQFGTDRWRARCPAHVDKNPSLSVRVGREDRVLLKCFADCDFWSILKALDLSDSDLFHDDRNELSFEEVYDYRDESGSLLYQVVRSVPKAFKHRCPDGMDGWRWKMNGVRRVPYRLPELIDGIRAGRTAVVAEGERKVDRLYKLGFVATCNSGGAGKWCDEWREFFAGADVVILPDNDEPGHGHAEQVARSLSPVAKSVKVVMLPSLPEKGDIIDWTAQGHTAEDLTAAIAEAPHWKPKADPRSGGERADIIRISDIEREFISWAWRGFVPFGKVTIIDGDPGLGKSTLTLDIASRLSRGEPMPDGAYSDLDDEPANSIVISYEDDPSDTIRPRLDANGADLERILVLRGIVGGEDSNCASPRPWQLPRDLAKLQDAIIEHEAKFVIIDPLAAALEPGYNPYRDTDMRRALLPLGEVAQRTGSAIVLVRHLNKGTGMKAIYRGGGSIGIVGAVRSALLVARDPEDETGCVLAVLKSNLSCHATSRKFRVVGATGHGCGRIVWGGESAQTADSLLNEPQTDRRPSEVDLMADLLLEATESGPIWVDVFTELLRDAGLSIDPKQRARARDKAGLVSSPPIGANRRRYYHRPGDPTPPSPDKVPDNISSDRTDVVR